MFHFDKKIERHLKREKESPSFFISSSQVLHSFDSNRMGLERGSYIKGFLAPLSRKNPYTVAVSNWDEEKESGVNFHNRRATTVCVCAVSFGHPHFPRLLIEVSIRGHPRLKKRSEGGEGRNIFCSRDPKRHAGF